MFKYVLGLTKPLSDTLQAKQLNLATAIDLVDSTCKTLKVRRNEKFFQYNLWKQSSTLAQNMNIDGTIPCAIKRLSRPPQALQEGVIITSIGARATEQNDSAQRFYRQRYYEDTYCTRCRSGTVLAARIACTR